MANPTLSPPSDKQAYCDCENNPFLAGFQGSIAKPSTSPARLAHGWKSHAGNSDHENKKELLSFKELQLKEVPLRPDPATLHSDMTPATPATDTHNTYPGLEGNLLQR